MSINYFSGSWTSPVAGPTGLPTPTKADRIATVNIAGPDLGIR
jgi:hypothetical protein